MLYPDCIDILRILKSKWNQHIIGFLNTLALSNIDQKKAKWSQVFIL